MEPNYRFERLLYGLAILYEAVPDDAWGFILWFLEVTYLHPL